MIGLTMCSVTLNQFPIKNVRLIPCFSHLWSELTWVASVKSQILFQLTAKIICGLKSLTLAYSKDRTVRMPQVWSCRLVQSYFFWLFFLITKKSQFSHSVWKYRSVNLGTKFRVWWRDIYPNFWTRGEQYHLSPNILMHVHIFYFQCIVCFSKNNWSAVFVLSTLKKNSSSVNTTPVFFRVFYGPDSSP